MDQYLIEQKNQHEKNQNHQTFTLKQIAQVSPQQILGIILQKEKIIQSFSQQITRLKAQQIKSKKLITSLQQKIQKTMSSGTNTSNTFMIASEFKNLLTSFMTNTVPSVFYDFADHPKIYSFLLKKILLSAYNKIQQILQGKLRKIVSLLRFGQKNTQGSKENSLIQEQLRICLLNYFQNSFNQIFPSIYSDLSEFDQQASKQNQLHLIIVKISKDEIYSEILQKIQKWNQSQNQNSQEMRQFCHQLYQICIYMVLQQNPWQFVFDYTNPQNKQNKQKVLFTKKQFTCIDGFVKQGKQVIYVLKGLRKKQNSDKEYHYHPNIRNFVIPANEDQTQNSLNLQVEVNIFKIQQKSFNQFDGRLTKKQNEIKSYKDQEVQLNLSDFQSLSKQVSNKSKFTEFKSICSKNHQSFRIQAVEQTQKSELIESINFVKKDDQKLALRRQYQNCVINPLNDQNGENNENDKQNINNINCPNTINFVKQKHSQSHTKKQKHLVQQKGILKKSKKQKNNSTVDLTNQKRKLSQKDQHYNNREVFDDISNNVNNLRSYELPLGHGKSSNKKKVTGNNNNNKNSTSRKCSVGKIVSQSIHLGMNIQTKKHNINNNNKQKISLSQHSTILMKQPQSIKNPTLCLKDNFVIANSNQLENNNDYRDKQNIGLSHIYQKPLTRPKRSMKLAVKNQDKIFNSHNNHNGSKQQRPLIMRQHKNNNNVGRLRQKYLIN